MSLFSENTVPRQSRVLSAKTVRARPGKHIFDIILSLGAIAFLFPALAIIALALLITDGRPIIFKHKRIGANGKQFNCLKFRTMRKDADAVLADLLANDFEKMKEWKETQKLTSDPRVHAVGKYLRITSMDELPQLVNVLRGEMSIVGPRPIVADEMKRYGPQINCYLAMTPGITGLWQVSPQKNASYDNRVRLDVEYYQTCSLMLDLIIIWRTIGVVLFAHNEK